MLEGTENGNDGLKQIVEQVVRTHRIGQTEDTGKLFPITETMPYFNSEKCRYATVETFEFLLLDVETVTFTDSISF
jgi:hypothetical protein